VWNNIFLDIYNRIYSCYYLSRIKHRSKILPRAGSAFCLEKEKIVLDKAVNNMYSVLNNNPKENKNYGNYS
jgi:hypothetical protein